MIVDLADEAATEALAGQVAPRLEPGDRIALDGPMGAGKTTFVRALVVALGGDATHVSSPTYTLLHRYEASIPVIHVDACRLDRPEQLAALGFEELAAGAIAVVEWAARVADALAGPRLWSIAFDHAVVGRRAVITLPAGATL
jgi:tRNA threonylcarbamoyl adenosine modification protein YjeE